MARLTIEVHGSSAAGRIGWPFQVLRDLVISGLVILIWVASLRGISFLKTNLNKDNIAAATFVIGFLGFAGTFGKVVYEWRLKARSENRQKWINDIRMILAELIQNMPSSKDNDDDKLNPSEKDHRALLALIRHIYKFPNVPIDENAPKRARPGDARSNNGFRQVKISNDPTFECRSETRMGAG